MKHLRLARIALALTPLSLSLALLPVPASAQAPAGPVNDGLPAGTPPLTPSQRQKQQARAARFRQDMTALQANTTLSPEQKQQQFQAMQAALDKDMFAILSPVQQKAVTKQRTMVTTLRVQFLKQHQGEINKEKQLGTQLQTSITSQQKQKMTAINQQAQTQIQKTLSDPKTAPDVKQQTAQAIARDAQRQGLAVLTPAQQSLLTQVQGLQKQLTQELAAFAKAHGQQ